MVVNLFCTTFNIKQDGTGDFTTIQAGINASQDNDIVLVYPGTYMENINFSGKNITVASLFYSTNQEIYKYNTIIDGHRSGSCVQIKSGETNAHLIGFTLQNGNGTWVVISFPNCGGAVYVSNSTCYIDNCIMTKNSGTHGGGVFGYQSTIYLSGSSIHENITEIDGGGIEALTNSSIFFSSNNFNSVFNNYSARGQDINIMQATNQPEIVLDTMSVISNEIDEYFIINPMSNTFTVSGQHQALTLVNHDLYISPDGNDQNSGLTPAQPWRTIARAMHLIESDSLNPKTIYLAPGTYSRNQNQQIFPVALKSFISLIGTAPENTIFDAELHKTHLNIYKKKNITIRNISFINSYCERANTKPFDTDDCSNLILSDLIFHDNNVDYGNAMKLIRTSHVVLNNIQIYNQIASNGTTAGIIFDGYPTFIMNNIVFNDLHSDAVSGGVVCFYTVHANAVINNCIMSNNSSFEYGLMQFSNSEMPADATLKMSNCLIFNNICQNGDYGGGVLNILNHNETPLQISNCTIANNHGTTSKVLHVNGIENYDNMILYNPDIANEIYIRHGIGTENSLINLNYSCLRGGLSNVSLEGEAIFNWGDGNITSDPGFIGGDFTSPDYYKLATGSPCIDAGTPDTTGLYIYPSDLSGNPRVWNNRIDMGCYEYDSHGNNDNNASIPDLVNLRNYPNPIRLGSEGKSGNPYTFFEFTLKDKIKSKAVINIYNIKGQKVRTLDTNKNISDLAKACGLSGKDTAMYNANAYSVVWDAKGDNFKSLPTGVYVYTLSVDGKHVASNKCLILK